MAGIVYLVGAGPGGPELLTRRGGDLLAQADCVIYDRLVDPRIVRLAASGCERINVGKTVGEEGGTQAAINTLLVRKARRHRVVVRLKGGDPLIFGRGMEEVAALKRAKIACEIVPGVSSVQAAGAYAGIPLTDRTLSSSVTIVTGQESATKSRATIQWKALARGSDTLVILMGHERLPAILTQLRRAGRAAATPIALVRWAGRPEQSVLTGTLATIEPLLAQRPEFGPPVVAIIGDVVTRREQCQWWTRPPLAGRRIVVTRAEGDTSELIERLESLGATCLEVPAIAIVPRSLGVKAEAALAARLASYDWVVFGSAHGVKAVMALLARQGRDARAFGTARVCAIGPKTASALEGAGITPDLVPADASTKGVAAAFRRLPLSGATVLIPRSSLAIGDALARGLRAKGAVVSEIPLYDTTLPHVSRAALQERLGDGAVDIITFTSASTVRNFFLILERAGFSSRKVLNGAQVACIGPRTAAAAKQAGLAVHITPRGAWTLDGLIEAIVAAGARP
ncbi:MAG: uroporphyrinogen-III C-methyltransferase [Candidatus Omnitrophica bacterium]|nr:uroporphyrinogen-III C-methyltransferase [Candidatus Omnitrophota bacterium]